MGKLTSTNNCAKVERICVCEVMGCNDEFNIKFGES
jgi:hypothetical protein